MGGNDRPWRSDIDALRALWCEWDPIGVMSDADWPRDEYDAYLGPTLSHLSHGTSAEQLERYLAQVTLEEMGLSETPAARLDRLTFARRLLSWYESKHT
jgi:hypothetical protein